MKGELFRYGQKPVQVAFQSGQHPRQLVLIPGLTDGLLTLTYTSSLATTLDSKSWSFVQPLLSSSYQGFGTSSLDQDASEVRDLLVHLKKERSCAKVVLMGHSTGCQDIVRFMKLYKDKTDISEIQGTILQAPVSDQEHAEALPETESRIQDAGQMVAKGLGEDILLRDPEDDGAPITAKRFLALNKRYGDDDMFSSYLLDQELKAILGHMECVPSLVLCSENDEYIPNHIDREHLWQRIGQAMGPLTEVQIVQGANHGAEGAEDEIISFVTQFLTNL